MISPLGTSELNAGVMLLGTHHARNQIHHIMSFHNGSFRCNIKVMGMSVCCSDNTSLSFMIISQIVLGANARTK